MPIDDSLSRQALIDRPAERHRSAPAIVKGHQAVTTAKASPKVGRPCLTPSTRVTRTQVLDGIDYWTRNSASTGRWSDGMTPLASRVSTTCTFLSVRCFSALE